MRALAALGLMAGTMLANPASALVFTTGDIVVSVEGDGGGTGTYTDNQAAPLTLYEYTPSGTFVGAEVLPTAASGSNFAVSGEYGSSSEGFLQLSGNGEYLSIMGYGVNPTAFNADPSAYGDSTTALAQSSSVPSADYTAVPRVVALINSAGQVNTQTAAYNVFDQNNPRSVYTYNGSTFYISGQGNSPDQTGGVFYLSNPGVTASPTRVTGADTQNTTGSGPNPQSQDTRFVTVVNGTLYVSVDSKEGNKTNRDFVGTLGDPPATDLYDSASGPTMLPGFGGATEKTTGEITVTTANENGINDSAVGKTVNLSPEEFFFANATTLYVADSGDSKQSSASSALGDGGLQKWSLVDGTWDLDYTLSAGLDLVSAAAGAGSSGLFALTGEVVGNDVYLYSTNYSLTDTGQTYLYEIVDSLNATTLPSRESFVELAQAPADSNFKGVSFAPTVTVAVPEPGTWTIMLCGVGLVGGMSRVRRRAGRHAAA